RHGAGPTVGAAAVRAEGSGGQEGLERFWKLKERTERDRREKLAREAAKKASAAPVNRPTVGGDWHVLPGADHAELERFTRSVHELTFHGIPWPAGWICRWAWFDPDPVSVTLAMASHGSKQILVDPRRVNESNFLEVLVHELAHVLHPEDGHGPAFKQTLDMALLYLQRELASVPPRPTPPDAKAAAWSPPQVPMGARYRPGGVAPTLVSPRSKPSPRWRHR